MGRPALDDVKKARAKRFSERLKFAMNARKILGKDLAKALNVKPATITDWRKGRTSPQSQRMPDVARALGVSEAYLLGETQSAEHEFEAMALELAERLGPRLIEPLLKIPKRPLRHLVSIAVSDYFERAESTGSEEA